MKSSSLGNSSLIKAALVMPLAEHRGGCETQLLNLLTANLTTAQMDYKVCFLEQGSMVEQVRSLGYTACVIEAGRLRQVARYVASVAALAKWLRAEGATHVISWMEKAHLYAAPAAACVGIPTAWWLRSIDPSGKLLRLISLLPTSHTFACSRAALDAWNPKWRSRNASICYSAVNLDRFDASKMGSVAESKVALGLPIDRPIVGIVARLQRWKGIDIFIEAAARLRACTNAFFVIIGGTHDLEPDVLTELVKQAEQYGLNHCIKFAGYQPNVPQWMQACDVVVHASTRPEPLGIVILEAMSLGKRVIATNIGGPNEIITHESDGLLIPPNNVDALTAAIKGLLEDTPPNRAMALAAMERAKFFSATLMAMRLANALKQDFGNDTLMASRKQKLQIQ